MKKTFNVLRWTVTNGLFLWAVIAATMYGSKGAGNIVIFLTVFLAIGSVLASKDQKLIKNRAIKGFPVGKSVDGIFNAVVVLILIWHTWWVSGTIYLIYAACSQVFRTNVEKRVAEIEESKKCHTPYPTITIEA